MHRDARGPSSAESWNPRGEKGRIPTLRLGAQKRIRVYERIEFPDFFISSGEANHPLGAEEAPRPLSRDLQLDRL